MKPYSHVDLEKTHLVHGTVVYVEMGHSGGTKVVFNTFLEKMKLQLLVSDVLDQNSTAIILGI